MKAKFLALAALVLGLASCQNDPDVVAPVGADEVTVQLAVSADELATRAGKDGAADTQAELNSAFGAIDYLQGNAGDYRQDWNDVDLRYVLEVYDVATDYTNATPVKDRQVIIKDAYEPVVFDLRLVPNREYRFVVFADFVANGSAALSEKEQLLVNGIRHEIGATLADITVFNEAINDEVGDAYFAIEDIEITNSAAQNIVLRRPYGKIRVVATDLAELNTNIDPKSVVFTYNALNPNKFNAVTGAISGEYVKKEFNGEYIDKVRTNMNSHIYNAGYDAEVATAVNGTTTRNSHITLVTDYILATDTQKAIQFTMTVNDATGKEIKTTVFNTDIPVQRNYLTTVIGNVLTTATEIKVTIDDNFAGEKVYSASFDNQLEAAENEEHAVINLDADVMWNTGASHGSTPWISATAVTKTLTINANGHKIIATGDGVGPIRMANGGKLIFNDAIFVDQSVSYNENAWELGYLEMAGNLEFNDCTFENAIMVCGGTANNTTAGNAVFNNCKFNSHKDSEYGVWVSGKNAVFNNSLFEGPRGLKMHEAYGSEIEKVVVNGCTFKELSQKPGIAIGDVNAETTVEIKNSVFDNCQPGDQGLYMYETDTDVATFDFSQTNNTVNATVATSEAFATVLKADIHTLNIALEGDVNVDVAANSADYFFGGKNTNTITINGAKVSTAAATGAGNNTYALTFNHTNSDWNYIRLNNDNAKWVIKNVKLTNSGHNNGPWNRHDISFFNDVELTNVTSDKAIALFGDSDLTNVIISDVHPNNSEAYALWIRPLGQTVNIKDCALLAHESKTTDRGIKIDNQYVNEGEAKVTLNVDGLKVKSQKKAAIVVKSKTGADINIKNIDITEVAADKVNAVWVDSDAKEYAGLVNVTGASKVVEDLAPIAGDTTEEVQEAFAAAVAVENAVVQLPAGEFTLPATVANGVNIIGTEGTKIAPATIKADNVTIQDVEFAGNKSASPIIRLSGKNPTLVGCTFTGAAGNGQGVVVSGKGEDDVITLKNCDFSQDDFFKPIFDGWSGLNGGTLILDGCTLANGLYTMHIDANGKPGHIIVKNSVVAGFTTNGASLDDITFENCVFGEAAGYACVNLYTAHSFINCTFPTKADANNVSDYGLYVSSKAKGDTMLFDNCKMSDGTQLDFSNIAVDNGGFLHWDSDTENCKVIVNGTVFAANQEALKAVLAAGETDIFVKAGNYEFYGLNFAANEVKIAGADKENTIFNLEKSIYLQNKSVTLENLTFNLNAGKGYTEQAFAFIHHATAFNLKNCNVNRIRLNVYSSNIEDCTFTLNTSSGFDGYCIYYYGNNNSTVNVKNSTFATAGKAICIYSESAKAYNLNVEKCSFTSSDSATDKAAIQMHTELGISGNVKISETTATGFAAINNGLWNELNNNTKVETDKFDIWVDGVQVH